MRERLDDLLARKEQARNPGSERSVKRQHDRGKMLARERIEYLLDDGSFRELDMLARHRNPDIADRARLAEFNPFLHFLEIVRRPLLGQDQVWRHWVVVIAITVIGWALTMIVMRRYRSRVSYWV